MKELMTCGSVAMSRRTLLQGVAIAGLVPVLALSANPATAADSKVSQVSVAYQGKPHGDQQCANCSLFQSPASCKSVAGTISPGGWCKIWVKKSA